jgi:uncharacterized protein with von Willebrand factor type A (vWA) domain
VHLRNNPHLDKKVLLVITDGQDNMSQETLQDATQQLQKANGPTIYAVGLVGSGTNSSGRDALERWADGTAASTSSRTSRETRTPGHPINRFE